MPLFFDHNPASWKELEQLVHQAFVEMGYEAAINHELKLARGTTVIDVYAVNNSTPIPTVVLCECKYWKERVKQNVVQAFRTICADAGAHYGIIISKAGFQKGAEEVREKSNVHLLDFQEFQETFFREWKTGTFMNFAKMNDTLLPLLRHDKEVADLMGDLNLLEKYEMFYGVDKYYATFFIGSQTFGEGVTMTDPRGDPFSRAEITIKSHREYFEVGKQAVADAKAYFGLKDAHP